MSGTLFKGVGVSSGIARGKAFVLVAAPDRAIPRRCIAPEDLALELERFEAALAGAEAELAQLQQTLAQQLGPGEANIFAAQALMVRSSQLVEPVRARVLQEQVNVEAALLSVLEELIRTFEALSDAVLRERAADLRDVGKRVLSRLMAGQTEADSLVPAGAIVVASELLPSVSARLELGQVAAWVTERGGNSSHASILARARGITAVSGIALATTLIKTGDELIVDGITGVVFIDPSPTVRREYERIEDDLQAHAAELQQLAELPSVTADGVEVPLLANINAFADTEAAHRHRADGIGLYRTEFAFQVRPRLPTEDEQYEFLERAAARFHPRPVTFRLLDIGGDKELPYLPLPPSRNPALAQRGIRLLLEHEGLLRSQLRAFLRVSAHHPVSILVPVVGGLEEVRRVRAVVREVQGELAAQGVACERHTPVGAMIEVPSAALLAGALAKEVDFLCLGTNDLVQYLLAVDREDARMGGYYQPLHPAMLRLIHAVAEAARAAGCPLTICGEMAGIPAYAPLLLGLGVRRFSVAPGQMLEVKNAIRKTHAGEAELLARQALTLGTTAEIEALLGR